MQTPENLTNSRSPAKPTVSFPIVGIGASAGGLAALEGFFANLPADSNMAFVIIQHLDPTYKSLMGSLLEKFTALRIIEITDGREVEPNCIYLNPPGKNVIILNGALLLLDPVKTHGLNLPIDRFFQALAEDQKEKAVCIILSGTGSDGTLGLKAIKGAGGMTMVQAERQAEYAGMPGSAIDTGLVDVVLPVEELAAELQKYVQHPYVEGLTEQYADDAQFGHALLKICALLRTQLGHDFSGYKEMTVRRRIERRMAVHRIEQIAEYVRYLQENTTEVHRLFKDLLIGVTNFFRDPAVFAVLKDRSLPALLANRPADLPLRLWVPGCATGEEAYSLAMLVYEVMETLGRHGDVQVFASDLDGEAIEYARNAVYPESIAADVTPERLHRFFFKQGDCYAVKKQIREAVVFAVQNLIKDPPFSKLDLVSCRNLLIYFKPELQKKVLALFHYTLNPRGFLVLGNSESIGDLTTLFSPFDAQTKIFQREEFTGERLPDYPLIPFFDAHLPFLRSEGKEGAPRADLRRHVERVVIEDYAPPCVIINDQAQILYFLGRTDQYLETPRGEPMFNLFTMARQGLQAKLKAAVQQVSKQRQTVVVEGVRVKQQGGFRTIDLVVRPLFDPNFSTGTMLVVFHEAAAVVSRRKPSKPRSAAEVEPYLVSLELELQSTKDSLQSTIEELETANEELRSANEELQSVNEELQSSNEELKTSKEEMQSTNEELTTVNTELQHKVAELSRANDDINNLLASTEVGTIFLDANLHIKRFTPAMKQIFPLIPSDLERPLEDITSHLDYADLGHDAKAVLDTLARKEFVVRSRPGRWYSVRMVPYRTTENVIDGVVVTFIDMTAVKQAEEAQQTARRYAEHILAAVREPFLVLDAELRVQSANPAFYAYFGATPAETVQRRIYELGGRQWDLPSLRTLLEEIIPQNASFDDYAIEAEFPGRGRRKLLLNARRIEQTGSQPQLILLAFEDVTAKGK